MKKIDRTGEIAKNFNGRKMKIIEYKNNKAVTVQFIETGEIKKASYFNFKRGKVYSKLDKRKHNKMKKYLTSICVTFILLAVFMVLAICVAALANSYI